MASSGTTFILAKTVLEEREAGRLGTAWGEAKNDLEDCEPFSSQSGRAEARITMTESWRSWSVLIRCPVLLLTRRGT